MTAPAMRAKIIDRLSRVRQGHTDAPLFDKLDRREIDDLVEAVAAICAATPRRIRLSEVLNIVPLSSSTIYDRMKKGTFPKSKDLGGGVVCWRESDILEWLDALPESNPGSIPGNDTENNLGVSAGVSEKKAA